MPQDLRAIHCKECPQKKMGYSQDLNMKALEDHCGSHHRGQTVETQFLLKCRLCRSQFTPAQSSKWSEHCKNDHQDSQKLSKSELTKKTCVYCPEGRMFPSAKDLADHKIEEHKDAHFRCRWCPSEAFDTFRTLTKHLTEKHKTRPENYLENTVLPSVLNQFTCLVCDVILFNDSYATHFRTKHPTLAKAAQENCEGRVRLACRVCSLKTGLSFKSLEELKAHVATHRIPKKPTPSSNQQLVS